MDGGARPEASCSPADTGSTMDAERSGWSWLAGVTSGLVGGLITVMGLAHVDGVIVTAMRKGYAYDFRLGALLLVGTTLVFGGALCLSAVRGLARGDHAAWGRAVVGTLLLLLVLLLMSPMQPDMAPGLAFVAAVNLIVLLGARRGLAPD